MSNVTSITRVVPATQEVTVLSTQRESDGREITNTITFVFRPFPFGQWAQVFAHFEKIFNAIGGFEIKSDFDLVSVILKAMAEGGEEIYSLLSLATGKDRSFFNTIEGDAGLDMIMALVEVNKRFFEQRIQPKVQEAKETLKQVGVTS